MQNEQSLLAKRAKENMIRNRKAVTASMMNLNSLTIGGQVHKAAGKLMKKPKTSGRNKHEVERDLRKVKTTQNIINLKSGVGKTASKTSAADGEEEQDAAAAGGINDWRRNRSKVDDRMTKIHMLLAAVAVIGSASAMIQNEVRALPHPSKHHVKAAFVSSTNPLHPAVDHSRE